MKTKLYLSVILISLCFNLDSVAQVTFQKTFGTASAYVFNSIRQTTDGGYILLGHGKGSLTNGLCDVCLIKTDINGDTLWTKSYGGFDEDQCNSVQQTTDSGFILAGGTGSFFGPGALYLIKTNSNGDTLWTRTNVGPGGQPNYAAQSVQLTNDGGYIVTGLTNENGNSHIFLMKLDTAGNLIWSYDYENPNFTSCGYSVRQTLDGGYIVAGETSNLTPTNYDVYVIKTDSSGNLIWAKTYGGINSDNGYDIEQTSDSGYIVTGFSHSFTAGDCVYLIKTNSTGDTLWTKVYIAGITASKGYSVHQTTDTGYIIAGYAIAATTAADVFLIKTNALGNILWTKTTGRNHDDKGYSVCQTTDGGYAVAGESFDPTGPGSTVGYFIKTDSLGNSGCNMHLLSVVTASTTTLVSNPTTTKGYIAPFLVSTYSHVNSGDTLVTLCTTAGIWETTSDNSSIKISPNPVNDVLNVSLNKPLAANTIITITDMQGRVVGEKITNHTYGTYGSNSSVIPINVSALSQGVYLLRMDGVVKRFVKL